MFNLLNESADQDIARDECASCRLHGEYKSANWLRFAEIGHDFWESR
jgi:hypothetical protein